VPSEHWHHWQEHSAPRSQHPLASVPQRHMMMGSQRPGAVQQHIVMRGTPNCVPREHHSTPLHDRTESTPSRRHDRHGRVAIRRSRSRQCFPSPRWLPELFWRRCGLWEQDFKLDSDRWTWTATVTAATSLALALARCSSVEVSRHRRTLPVPVLLSKNRHSPQTLNNCKQQVTER